MINRAEHSAERGPGTRRVLELRGRRLGIVGYGNIGTQLSVLAEDLGMTVFFYVLQVHHNGPGVLAAVNGILADHGLDATIRLRLLS